MTLLENILLSFAAFGAGISIVVIYTVVKWFVTGEGAV